MGCEESLKKQRILCGQLFMDSSEMHLSTTRERRFPKFPQRMQKEREGEELKRHRFTKVSTFPQRSSSQQAL
jgi:hypothetical protein